MADLFNGVPLSGAEKFTEWLPTPAGGYMYTSEGKSELIRFWPTEKSLVAVMVPGVIIGNDGLAYFAVVAGTAINGPGEVWQSIYPTKPGDRGCSLSGAAFSIHPYSSSGEKDLRFSGMGIDDPGKIVHIGGYDFSLVITNGYHKTMSGMGRGAANLRKASWYAPAGPRLEDLVFSEQDPSHI